MNALSELCSAIDMPQEITQELLPFYGAQIGDGNLLKELTAPETYARAAKELKTALDPDERGLKTLCFMLTAALKTRIRYQEKGIPDDVYIKTMKCFSRFVKEHHESYGVYAFDRWYWTGRQLSMQLFRLGELEYETALFRDKIAVSVHIPSDADLSPERIDASLQAAKSFFRNYYPAYDSAVYFCESWLLSPALNNLLPANSKILLFQNRFRICATNAEGDSYKQWVFKLSLIHI